MKRSTDRILTTHVGSLPRPPDLLDVVQAQEQGRSFDQQAYAARLREAVAEVVRKQVDLGIDVVDDGEFGKPSFVSYVNERLGGSSSTRKCRGRAHGPAAGRTARSRNSTRSAMSRRASGTWSAPAP